MKLKISFKNFDQNYNNINKKKLEKKFKVLSLKQLYKLNINFFCNLKNKSQYTVLSSPHVHKKSRDQFQLNIFKILFNLNNKFNFIKNILKIKFRKELIKFFYKYLNFKLRFIFNNKIIIGYTKLIQNFKIVKNFEKKKLNLKIKLLWDKK